MVKAMVQCWYKISDGAMMVTMMMTLRRIVVKVRGEKSDWGFAPADFAIIPPFFCYKIPSLLLSCLPMKRIQLPF